jgi:hypothetical protein
MGNENASQKQITSGGKNENTIKGKNQIARGILANNVNGIPTNEQIAGALAIQQSQDIGPLKKTDLIAILIRLSPDKNNALLSQYKIEDLLKSIRYELYVRPFSGVKTEQYKQQPVQNEQYFPNIQVGDVDVKHNEYLQLLQNNQQLNRQLLQLNQQPIHFNQQLQYYEPRSNNGNIKQLEYHR